MQIRTILFFCLFPFFSAAHAQPFFHPGILHSAKDLQRMKEGVAQQKEPIYAGFQIFTQNPASQFAYQMQGPMDTVGRNPTVGAGTYDGDANAAHQNAVMWAITGDHRYADKAIQIVNAWSATLKAITGRDAVLMAGLGPFKMVNAAEILRYTNAGWQKSDIQQTEKHFQNVIYPVLKDFAPFANGNWDAAAIKTVMAIAVFCNDRPMFERALRYYTNGHGNGRLTYYVINEEGEIQESGRDQAHSQLGIGMLAECCAIAWNQGLDLYSYADNRLLKGFEYVAKFNLGNDNLPFQEWLDRTGKYRHTQISQQARGNLRALYEQVYNHYVNQMGLPAPYTQQAAEKLRPEGPGRPGADHPGYGTLYFSIPKGTVTLPAAPAAPAGLVAKGTANEVALNWVAAVGTKSYVVKRATKSGGPYRTIKSDVQQPQYTDKTVKAGTIYYYTVGAAGEKGESRNAFEIAVAAGLPAPWKQQDIGNLPKRGKTLFDGKTFNIEGTGAGVDSTADETHFTFQALSGDGEIIAQFVPQPSSQFSKMGLMIREAVSSDAPHVSLVIYPGKSGQIEAPKWQARLMIRRVAGAETKVAGIDTSLCEPAVTWGRLTGNLWLRLQRKGDRFKGATSYDGITWTEIGTETVPLKKNVQTGFVVSSGMPKSTTVFFDNVTISK